MPEVGGRTYSNGDTAIGVGLIVALIATFLPWYSASFSCSGSALCGGLNTSVSVSALNDWAGWLFFLGVLAGIALFVIRNFAPSVTLPTMPQPDAILFAALGVFLAVMALLWLLTHSSGASGPGYSVGPSFGLFIGLIAGIVVAVGGFLKRSDARPTVQAYSAPGTGSPYSGPPAPPTA
ncbi:MAG TPA: hypothetical protein VIN65_02770 [Candidatus Dormibacteraeota bacterium]